MKIVLKRRNWNRHNLKGDGFHFSCNLLSFNEQKYLCDE